MSPPPADKTFFSFSTPLAIKARMDSGATKDLESILPTWQKEGMWVPPKLEQSLQQGGLFLFEGARCVFNHFDPSTGAHADLKAVAAVAGQLAADAGCGEAACDLPGQ